MVQVCSESSKFPGFMDSRPSNFSLSHPTPAFSWTLVPAASHQVIPDFSTCYFPNKIPHTGACFAWPGGVREGRAAFATVSALPSQEFFYNFSNSFIKNLSLLLSSKSLHKELPPDVNCRSLPVSLPVYDSF